MKIRKKLSMLTIVTMVLMLICGGCSNSEPQDNIAELWALGNEATNETINEATNKTTNEATKETTSKTSSIIIPEETTTISENETTTNHKNNVVIGADGKVTIKIESTTKQEQSTSDKNSETTYVLKQSKVPTIDVNVKKYYAQYGYGTIFKDYGVYELDDDITMGAVDKNNLSKNSPDVLDYEAYYGLTAYTTGKVLYVKAYNHSVDHPIISSEIVSDMNDTKSIEITYDDYAMIDCKNYANGLYAVHTTFDKRDIYLYFYVNGNDVYTTRCLFGTANDNKRLITKMLNLNTRINNENVLPKNCLSIDNIVYPCIESPGHRCDTARWAQLSHDLLNGHYEWSDEFKVFVYTQWFIKNTKYDYYRTEVLGCSRAMKYGVWDGTYSLWDLKVGVCCDFSNAMIIMLREQGIPATSLESDTHMWVAVYIDNQWRELDITDIMPFSSSKADASDCISMPVEYKDYLLSTSTPNVITIGADIWTYNRAKYGHQ